MKKKSIYGIKLFIGLLLAFMSSNLQAQEHLVKVTGIRSPKGSIVINVFRDRATYDREVPCKQFTFKKALNSGSMTVPLKLEPGVYGITLVDDENENGKIDKNFIGVPKEGFGFSNFFMTKMKKPSFDEFKLDWKAQANSEIRMKYI